MVEQLRPAVEVVESRNYELGVGESELALQDLGILQPAESRMVPADVVECFRIPGLERLDEILRLLPGLLQVDAWRECQRTYDDLLSWKRLESAQLRLKEGSLRRTNSGWARPFPRTGGAPRAHV